MNYASNQSHVGDCVWALIALRKIPGQHTFFTPREYHSQLIQCCEDTEITLAPLEEATPDALSTWIGCGRFANQGVSWQALTGHIDLIDFLMKWSNCMCAENGMVPRFNTRQDMLPDFPAINRHYDAVDFEVLVINCPPKSGQCPRWDQGEMDELITEIGAKYRTIVTNPTTATNVEQVTATVCEIGNLALRAKFVVAVASGAHWGIHSVWSQGVKKYLFLDDPISLDYGLTLPMPQHGLVKLGMRWQLQQDGWLP